MTGEEFKRLIERRDPNDVVDTLQEVLAMFEGIGDGETIAEYIRRVAVTPESMPEDCIGTEQIKNNAVMLEDLNEEVRQKLTDTYDEEDEALYLGEPKVEEEER